MHLNYYALKRLVAALTAPLSEATFIEAFSQEKDELILSFITKNDTAFYIRATLTSTFTCLSFPTDFMRSRRNSVNQFSRLEGRKVSSIEQYLNERAFSISFGKATLLFKMHGNRSNVVLFEPKRETTLFKSSLIHDKNIDLNGLHRPIERNQELYLANPDPQAFYPTFGAVPKTYLSETNFDKLPVEEQWPALKDLVDKLDTNPFYLIEHRAKPSLSLLPLGQAEALGHDALAAYNHFYRSYTRIYYFAREKQRIASELAKRITRTENYIQKSETRLQALVNEIQPAQIADIIMANLHQIPPNQKTVPLYNFYEDKDVSIKLNPLLSPQKNAENYYRKSKNRKIEVEKTEANIFEKYETVEELKQLLEDLEQIEGHKAFKQFLKTHQLEKATSQKQPEAVPYKSFEFQNYQIWVGKNAKSNDQLTLKHAFKEDLWLHAKDVPGSHVLIKHQSGKVYPKNVIERAAELAAYYSKRKTDSLIPVTVTPAKFVRKRKGSLPGQVVVTKEEVIMVPSRGPSDLN